MKKRLTDTQFQAAVHGLDVGEQTREIAYGVLVQGMEQAHFVKAKSLSRGAVSQAVSRVWKAHEKKLPRGFERVDVVLPTRQAFIVKQWARDTAKKMEPKT